MDDTTSSQSGPDAAQLRVTLARLESLAELAFALSGAVTKSEVANFVVEQGMRQAAADIATLYVLADSGETLELLAHRGLAPEVLQRIALISKTQGNPRVLETLATGVSVWAETEREYTAIFPELASMPATGRRAKAFWSVPLVVQGRPVGLLAMGFYQEQQFSVADRRFVETFAKLCGQALLRAALAIENARAASELEAARAREQALRERAEQASITKDHFLATVSHELRTPLNVILGWAVVLRERDLSPEVHRALTVIERNARAQARLIEDVLDLSRISSGKLSLMLSSVNVGEAVRAAALALRPAAEAKDITLSVEAVDESALLTISADSDRLQQILWNLLTNALKFTPKAGSVAIVATRLGSEVQIRVTDSGEGIGEDVLPHIFEPFRQADSSTTRRHGGLGLGLALVRQIASAHGGSVEATSAGIGRGATFLVRLPARAATEAVRPSRPSHRPAPFGSGAGGLLSGVSILVVDDELDARELVAEAFKSAGAVVFMAASARDALDVIAAARPNVLVSDIGMPHEDGYALMRRVRELPAEQGGEIPALALTAYARTADAERAFDAGYQRHIAKPVDPLLLVQLVAGLAGRSTPVARSTGGRE